MKRWKLPLIVFTLIAAMLGLSAVALASSSQAEIVAK